MTLRHSLIALLICSLSCFEGGAQTTSSSSPTGFYVLDLEVGAQTIGVSILNPQLLVAEIASSQGGAVTLGQSMDAGALLDGNKDYYIEIIGGVGGASDSEVGQRFEVDVAGTELLPGQIALEMGSPRNTAATLPDLTDYTLTLREHVTIGQVFDKSKLHYSTSFADADQIQVFDGSGFSIYYLYGVDGQSQWTAIGSFASQDHRPIVPGEGLIFKRSALSPGAVSLTVLGEVRTTPFVQPLAPGANLVAEGFPLSLSFEQRSAYGLGFSDGDRMKVFEGGAFVTYRLYSQGDALPDNIWVLLGDPYFQSQNAATRFDYRGATVFQMAEGNENYRVDPPFSN